MTTAPKKKAFLYSRVSSKQQTSGQGIDRQDERGLEYYNRVIAPTGLPLDNTVRCDKRSAFKGSHLAKDGALRKILDEIAACSIVPGSILICENLDRISRQGPKLARQTLAAVTDFDVEIHVLNINQVLRRNWENNFGQSVVVDNELQRAWNESLSKSDRISRAKDAAKDKAAAGGWVLSRNVPSWLEVVGRETVGNKIIKPGTIQVIDEEAKVVQDAFNLASLGLGVKHIADKLNGRLNGKSLSWLTRTLADRSVLGEFTPKGKETIYGYYPAIIDQSLFDAAREQAARKRKDGFVCSGNRQKVDTAEYLFSGLLFDTTTEPVRTMYAEFAIRGHYVVSAYRPGRKQNRLRYDRVEKAVLQFLTKEDWRAVAGENESDEVKATRAALELTLRDLDKISRLIDSTNTSIDGGTLSQAGLAEAFERLAKDKERKKHLTEKKDTLQSNLEAARSRCSALYDSKTLFELIKKPESTDIRLRLRSELQKRIARINLTFFEGGSAWVTIEYLNSVKHAAAILESDGSAKYLYPGVLDALRRRPKVAAALARLGV